MQSIQGHYLPVRIVLHSMNTAGRTPRGFADTLGMKQSNSDFIPWLHVPDSADVPGVQVYESLTEENICTIKRMVWKGMR